MKHLFSHKIKFLLCISFSINIFFIGCTASKKTVETKIIGDIKFLDIYNNILSTNCMIPACHDGSFEPNFSTAQSAYYTTVMHKIIKNNEAQTFEYRIVPNDTTNSLLYERITNCCFINKDDKMPVLLEELTRQQIDSIGQWIMNGAPNWAGEFPYNTK